jgi:hypothetical protein
VFLSVWDMIVNRLLRKPVMPAHAGCVSLPCMLHYQAEKDRFSPLGF